MRNPYEEKEITLNTFWTAREFIENYQRIKGDYTPLAIKLNDRIVLTNETLFENLYDSIENNENILSYEIVCIPIGIKKEEQEQESQMLL